jgi:L-2-hydroxycarboxylate dehydrogenase (NAD+)
VFEMGEVKKPESLRRVAQEKVRAWGKAVLDTTQMSEEEKQSVLDVLIMSNLRGVETHGINLLPQYAERSRHIPQTDVKIVKDTGPCVMIDGGNHTGPYSGTIGTDAAIERAKKYGIGLAVVSNGCHYGAAAYYTMRIADAGLVGFTTTSTMPVVAPWGGRKALNGNNPFSVAIPGDELHLVLDIACSTTARQKMFLYQREGWKIPDGWAINKEGLPTNDPGEALEGVLTAFGEHKGAGIAATLQLLMGLLNTNGFDCEFAPNSNPNGLQQVSFLFIAIDPQVFTDEQTLKDRTADYYKRYREVPRIPGVERLFLPGEIEWENFKDRSANGIPLSEAILKTVNDYSDKYNIAPLE